MRVGVCWFVTREREFHYLPFSRDSVSDTFPDAPQEVFSTVAAPEKQVAAYDYERYESWSAVFARHATLAQFMRTHGLDVVLRLSPGVLANNPNLLLNLLNGGAVAVSSRINSQHFAWPFLSDSIYAVRAEGVMRVLRAIEGGRHKQLFNFGVHPEELLTGELLRNEFGGRVKAPGFRREHALFARYHYEGTNVSDEDHVKTCDFIAFDHEPYLRHVSQVEMGDEIARTMGRFLAVCRKTRSLKSAESRN